ncbi:uncharacterized protein LY79DRAFT_591824 [Colletotrichum navitas]|uniref:Centrosomin N-terminal motif 1 domain-containing protein n=1 Tax=Colletotrichum navitas TaxID=681940 RepID=A0AAD8PUY7_9PEZI|nr:uncharacterized protein LY79DRAFT_591824 [Colletotrichum navitas]KAK1584967.1 hypothetical protein LY79DRAFT_591824 [Colletotrichum navitas]
MESPARRAQSPSVKGELVDGRRPRSSGGNGETPKKTGMGAKEMEATVSTLHKQNFDLKLELFHRRERQTALEARIDALETEKAQMDDVNDRLLDELEKRDKAVQEAVQMILNLEAQVAMLLKEREMVQHFDAAGIRALEALEHRLDITTPKPRQANLARLEADAKALNRMPSFLSDHTENTENLRNVYLSSRGSLLSLSRLATEGEDADARRVNNMTSPSLSVLSESSFTSVYGEKEDVARVNEPSPDNGKSPCSPEPSRGSDQSRDRRPPTTLSTRSSRNSRSNSFSRAPGPGQFQSIRDIVDHTSPLQQLANLDHGYPNRAPAQDQSPLAGREQPHKHAKDTKREAPRRVMTDTPVQRPGEQVLPPTPDTVSTPTLRRFKTSNDTLSNQRGVSDQRSYRSISDGTSKEDDGEDQGGAPVLQQPPRSAFVGHQEPARTTYFDTRAPLIPRPRSAGETTVSHHHEMDWDSDGDSVHSLDSSLDIWMQQGKDPKHFDESSYDSPDLFSSFPMPGGGWNQNTTVGPSGDGTFNMLGIPAATAAAAAAQHHSHMEDMKVVSNALFPSAVQQPPTPKRRSSLSATGLTVSKPPPANGKLRKSLSRAGSRRASIDAHAIQRPESVASTPQRTESKSGARSKNSHYPPSSTTASRGHRLNFFRRSISGGPVTAQPEPASPAAEPSPTAAAKASTMGVPSWVQRSHLADDDRDSATPPPIMRNPRPARSGSFDEGAPLNDQAASATTPTTPMAVPTRAASHTPTPRSSEPTPTSTNGGSGGAPLQKRKWLPGFSRGSSLRNRTG